MKISGYTLTMNSEESAVNGNQVYGSSKITEIKSNTEGYIIEGNNVRRIYNNDNYKRYVKSPRRD